MGKGKSPAELVLERLPSLRPYEDQDGLEHGDEAMVRVENRGCLAVVDTIFCRKEDAIDIWIDYMDSLRRDHRLRAPLVVGLAALRGRAPSGSPSESVRALVHPQHPDNPIRCIAICVGGSHTLLYQPDCYLRMDNGTVLGFSDKMKKLRNFLSDKSFTVACTGAKEVVEKLAAEWGLHVGRPVELTDLFARADGNVEKIPGVEPQPEPRMLASEGNGDKIGKAIRGLTMEDMARAALGPKMRLAPVPATVAAADWGGRDLGFDDWMYATRDAYLCFDIAAHCLAKLGVPVA